MARVIGQRTPFLSRYFDTARRRRWLLQMMPRDSVCAEIGVWRGAFSAQILEVVRPRTLHLIDLWRPYDFAEMLPGRVTRTREDDMEKVYQSVVARFKSSSDAGCVVIHRMSSQDAALELADDTLDWVYIDGDHSYEGAHADIAAYTPKVRVGGFVTGDDHDEKNFPGVVRAVREAIDSGDLENVETRGRQFVLRRLR